MRELAAALEAGDVDAVAGMLAEDVVFRSPAVHTPYQGRQATLVILRAVSRVFEDFRYTRTMAGGDDHAFVFEARVGTLLVEGVDLVHVGVDGLVDDFRVLVRPLRGLEALVGAMAEEIPRVMREQGLAAES